MNNKKLRRREHLIVLGRFLRFWNDKNSNSQHSFQYVVRKLIKGILLYSEGCSNTLPESKWKLFLKLVEALTF